MTFKKLGASNIERYRNASKSRTGNFHHKAPNSL